MRTIHRHCKQVALLFLVSSSALATGVPPNESQQQLLLPQNERRTANNDNLSPRERDVIANPICSSEALLNADISGNQFISRAEYVNLLLDLAPADCPVIDMWLNEAPLQQTFEELSCLCHEFGGIDGQNNCCLQAVNVPMLASFATPDSFYPEEYAAQACSMIDQVLVQECPSTEEPTLSPTTSPTFSPTSPPSAAEPTSSSISPTKNVGLSIITFDTVAPSTLPSAAPTSEMTESGELVIVEIEDGQVTTTVAEEHMATDPPQGQAVGTQTEEEVIQDPEGFSPPEEEAFVGDDEYDDDDASNDSDNPDVPPTTEEPADNTDNEIAFPIPSNNEEDLEAAASDDETKEKPLGAVLAALLCITSLIGLALFAFWGRRRGLVANPWKRDASLPTVTASNTDDIDTPRRSNARRSHSFSSDDEETSTDDDDDPDIERPHTSNKGHKSGVVRLEFLDDLSVWGRRKRRRQERTQRREERQRQSMEQNPPQHKNTITSILSTLEFDLNGGTEDGRSLRPSSTRSMVSMRSAGAASAATTKEDMVDIFDDRSDTSSYDGSPHNQRGLTMPLETSIEDWLDQQQIQGTSRISAEGSIVVDDRSVVSHMSAASKRSTASSRRSTGASPQKQLQRQANDPSLQEWAAHRHQQNTASCVKKLDYSKLSAPPAGSAPPSPSMTPYDLTHSRSYSPQRTVQHALAASASFSPSQSKPTYMLSSLSFSPASSPKRSFTGTTSQSVPASPVDKRFFKKTLFLKPVRSNSESSFHRRRRDVNAETKDSDSPLYSLQSISMTTDSSNNARDNWNPLHLDLPVEHTHHSHRSSSNGVPSQSVPLAPRLSPESQEFYDSVMRMEPPEDDEDDSMGNAFAFEAARPRNMPPPERYLV